LSVVLEQTVSEPKGRVEDRRLLTGTGRFVDDLKMEGQAYMGIVRSMYAHARIKRIDLSTLRSSPDFIAALTGEDLLKEGVATVSQNQWPPQKPAKRYHLAVGKVRFVGEPVAAILVRRKIALEDLIEQVGVDYEPLPVVTTIEESKKGTTLVFEDWRDNVSQSADQKWGKAEDAIASAPNVIRAKLGIARQESAPMEPHSVLTRYDRGRDLYEVFATVQSVHGLREQLASELHVPEEKFHVKVMDMGGGFGSKGAQSYPEPLLACLFSRRTGLPVKWTATRTEEFLEAATGRDEYCDIAVACDKEGRLVALKANLECDAGVTGTQNHMSQLSMWTMLGGYRIPNVDVQLRVYATNKMPMGPVRGAGAPEGTYFIERAMTIMAEKIGIDPLELRRRNLAPRPGQWGAGGLAPGMELIDALVKESRYQELLKWKSEVNSRFARQGPSKSNVVAGLGVSFRSGGGADSGDWSEGSGESESGSGQWPTSEGEGAGDWRQSEAEGNPSPSWVDSRGEEATPTLDFTSEYARVTLDKSGRATVYTGSSPHGQGEETSFAQLASEELGTPLGDVSVVWGDTALVPAGIGTFGSRSAATGGSAVVDACRKIKSQLFSKVATVTGVDAKFLSIRKGRFSSTTQTQTQTPLPTLAEVMEMMGVTGVSAESYFRLSSIEYSGGAHLCVITLDPELGAVRVVKYLVVEDCGRMINKTIVEGQLHGGVLHAIGGSLFEKLAYDDQGNLLTSTMMDYCIPTAVDSPEVEVFHRGSPSTATLDGVKGVGESGTNVGYAAVMNAINDALAQVRPGARIDVAPATPEAISAAIATVS